MAIDTLGYAGQSGHVDFLIPGQAASPVHATLTGFSGINDDDGAPQIAPGDVSGSTASGIDLGNGTGWNESGQWTRLGGHLAFLVTLDVGFDIGQTPGAGSTLEVALLDAGQNHPGAGGDVPTFAALPGMEPVVTATDAVRLPEGPAPAPCLTGLALLGLSRRRRRG